MHLQHVQPCHNANGRQGKFGVQYLAQGHYGEDEDRNTNLLVRGQPALPPVYPDVISCHLDCAVRTLHVLIKSGQSENVQ